MTPTVCFGLIRETLPNERRVADTRGRGASDLRRTRRARRGGCRRERASTTATTAQCARICLTATEVGHGADVLVKLHGPSTDEHALIRDGGAITGSSPAPAAGVCVHSFVSGACTRSRRRSKKPTADQPWRPCPRSADVSLYCSHANTSWPRGGTGRLLGGAPGVPPLNVVVIGAGAAGEAAAREAKRSACGPRPRPRLRTDPRLPSHRGHHHRCDQCTRRRPCRRPRGPLTAVATATPAPKVVLNWWSMPSDTLIIVHERGGGCTRRASRSSGGRLRRRGVRHLACAVGWQDDFHRLHQAAACWPSAAGQPSR